MRITSGKYPLDVLGCKLPFQICYPAKKISVGPGESSTGVVLQGSAGMTQSFHFHRLFLKLCGQEAKSSFDYTPS